MLILPQSQLPVQAQDWNCKRASKSCCSSKVKFRGMFPFKSSQSGDKKLKSSQKDSFKDFIALTQTGDERAFVQYLWDGPIIMGKVVHIPRYVKPCYIYQLILSQLSWNEHSSGSDKINWYMYQDFTYFGMYHFPQSFWQKTIFLPTYNSWVCHN